MKVIEREPPNMSIKMLIVTDVHALVGVHAGETVAYRCESGAGDETLARYATTMTTGLLIGSARRQSRSGRAPTVVPIELK